MRFAVEADWFAKVLEWWWTCRDRILVSLFVGVSFPRRACYESLGNWILFPRGSFEEEAP